MKQRKQLPQKQSNTLKDFFNRYDSVTLLGLVNTFENTEAWEIFKSYASVVQRRYEVEALDCMGKDGEEKKAAYASGYAKASEDIVNAFMEGLKQTAMNVSPVIENNREEDKEPITQFD